MVPRLKKICPSLFSSHFLEPLFTGITKALCAAKSLKILLKQPYCHQWESSKAPGQPGPWTLSFRSLLELVRNLAHLGFYHRNSPRRERQLAKEKHLKIIFHAAAEADSFPVERSCSGTQC